MRAFLVATPLALSLFAAPALAEVVREPGAATPEGALVGGLSLLRDGKFDDWIKGFCSKAKLCLNENSLTSLKRYNLPAKQRRAAACLREGGAAVEVNRVDDLSPTEKKLFINCEPTAMPVPFFLVKEGDRWLFSNI
jgi:hypothetical protein